MAQIVKRGGVRLGVRTQCRHDDTSVHRDICPLQRQSRVVDYEGYVFSQYRVLGSEIGFESFDGVVIGGVDVGPLGCQHVQSLVSQVVLKVG